MSDCLQEEVRQYCALTKGLVKVLDDTKEVFSDINSAKCFIGNQAITGELSSSDEQEIRTVATQAPCFVVYGDTAFGKAAVVNQLFHEHEDLISVSSALSASTELHWRTILFRNGSKNRYRVLNYEDSVASMHKKSKLWTNTLPVNEIQILKSRSNNDDIGFVDHEGFLDVQFKHPLLAAGARVAVAGSDDDVDSYERVYNLCTRDVNPIIMYAISSNCFNEKELEWLKFMRSTAPDLSLFFIRVNPATTSSSRSTKNIFVGIEVTTLLPPSSSTASNNTDEDIQLNGRCILNGSSRTVGRQPSSPSYFGSLALLEQLVNLGFMCNVCGGGDGDSSTRPPSTGIDTDSDSYSAESELLESIDSFWSISSFVRSVLQRKLVSAVSLTNVVHVRCLEMMITLAHDMQWDVMCTPTKLSFAKEKEDELYKSLLEMTSTKQDEIKRLITETVTTMQEELISKAADYQFVDVAIPESGLITSAKDLKLCTAQIKLLVLKHLNASIADNLTGSIDVLRDSYTGVLTRTLQSLEQKDSEPGEMPGASKALSEILNAAYNVEITVCTGASFVKSVIEKMKQLMHAVLWRSSPRINAEWKRKVAADMFATLGDKRCQRLASSICAQIQERLRRSHQTFATSMRQLEMRHNDRLGRTAEQRENVARLYAPRVARLALESRSLKDLITYGKPLMGYELGRGQYGVVFSCDSWGGFGPCAVKSVVPPDDRHWNDLALEYYYYKNVPEHERIVALRGSIIDYMYTGGSAPVPAALLIMDRLKWDLYEAIKGKLNWISRLQVSVDVVEGIRYLHSRGLVHRDVKLKNVLLDDNGRGKLTDLGFCKPEAMMSGSVVGSPIHMAPELFSGKYNHSVDVYAFGILFWYVCACTVNLPRIFETCPSKEMLWQSVRAGLRPEKPPNCDLDCWDLMSECWNGDADKRPIVGEVEIRLRAILTRFTSPCDSVSPLSLDSASPAVTTDGDMSDSDMEAEES